MKMSPKQKSLLAEMAETPLLNGKRIPLYVEHWSRADSFFRESDRRRFLENMESRGLIRIENYSFLHLP